MDQEITENHLPGQYLDIALVPGQYLDIALAAGQYKIYCPALAFDPPTQSVTYIYITYTTATYIIHYFEVFSKNYNYMQPATCITYIPHKGLFSQACHYYPVNTSFAGLHTPSLHETQDDSLKQ